MMFKRKIKWYLLFDNKKEFDDLFQQKECVIYKGFFGEFLLIKREEKYYAFKNKCPHQNKSMEGCHLEENQVVCPWHRYQYSLEDGRGHGLNIDKFPLKIEEDKVYVGKETWSLFG